MSFDEQAQVFSCGGARCVAIINRPRQPCQRGVLIVVGGPQYRAGSHRQFTLLCRALAERGIAAMRFDYRGMGDSEGETRTFEDLLPDIRQAIDHFCLRIPELREVAIWGLCDAASAALFYAHLDPRVTGLVLLNPWVRTDSGLAKAQLKHYYRARLADPHFWRKVARGEFAFARAVRSFASVAGAALRRGEKRAAADDSKTDISQAVVDSAAPLPERMAEALGRFKGKVLLILSGRDLTAQEFNEVVRASRHWGELLSASRVERRELPAADHTFSRREWRDQVAAWTADWMLSL